MAGRPSKLKEENIYLAAGMATMGATDVEIAEKLGVNEGTIYNWKNNNPELFKPLKAAKDETDSKVEASLYKMATGFTYKAKKPMVVGDGGGLAHVEIVEYEETVLPNTTSMIFWLKNRQPAKWRDKQEMEHSGGIGVTIVDDIK
jgi:hypothetical protein